MAWTTALGDSTDLRLPGIERFEERSLTPLVAKYVRGRVRRGEVKRATAANSWSTLRVFAEVHGARPVKAINVDTVERWMERRSGIKPSTKRLGWSTVHRFLDWLVRERELRENPMRRMTPPRRPRTVPRAIDEEAIAKLLDVVPDARARLIVWLMVGLGLRCVEVHHLKVEDWSQTTGVLLVTGKGGHQRELPMVSEVAAALNAYLGEHPASSGPLIRDYRRCSSLMPATLSHYMSDWMRLAGVKQRPYDGVSAHALRHTAASDVLDRCGDLRVIQEMLGHQHLASTSVYLRRAQIGALRDAMAGRTYRGLPDGTPSE